MGSQRQTTENWPWAFYLIAYCICKSHLYPNYRKLKNVIKAHYRLGHKISLNKYKNLKKFCIVSYNNGIKLEIRIKGSLQILYKHGDWIVYFWNKIETLSNGANFEIPIIKWKWNTTYICLWDIVKTVLKGFMSIYIKKISDIK